MHTSVYHLWTLSVTTLMPLLFLLPIGAFSQGEIIVEANCTNEDSQANFVDVKWGFGPAFDSSRIVTCYAEIDCNSIDNTTKQHTNMSSTNACEYEWRFKIPLDFDFCEVSVSFDHLDYDEISTSTNCSFSAKNLMVTSTPSTASTFSTPVNNNMTDISSATLHTTNIAPEVHVDPTVTLSSVSVATVLPTSAHSPNTGSSQTAIVISLVVALLMLVFFIICLGIVLNKIRRKLPIKMHMKKEKVTKYMMHMPSPFDDNYAYSTYGKDAPSTVESLGVNNKVADWMGDLHMPSIDEECGSVISDDITNEEMLDYLYGRSTTTHKKQVKSQASVGSADSGVGSENRDKRDSYISEQRVEELLHTTSNEEGEVSPDTETALWNEGDGQGNSRPSSLSSLLSSTNKHDQDMGNPTAVDTPTTPVVGSSHGNSFPKSRKFASLVINRLPSVSDSVFMHSLSEGSYVDHRIASSSDSACQSPNVNTSVGKASPGFENIPTPSFFVHDNNPHNAFSSGDQCVTPTIGVYQPQNTAFDCVSVENDLQSDSTKSEVSHTFFPYYSDTNTMVVNETVASSTPCIVPFHIVPIKETSTMLLVGQYNSGVGSNEVGNYASHDIMSNDENIVYSANGDTSAKDKVYNEAPFSSEACNSQIKFSHMADQHTMLTDGVYLPHCEDASDVNRAIQQYTSSELNYNHTMSRFEHVHITPSAGEYTPHNTAVEDFHDTVSQTSLSQNSPGTFTNVVPKSSGSFSANEVANLSCYDQHSTATTGLYVPCDTAVNCDQPTTLNKTSMHHQQQSYDQDCVSVTTIPVALSNYISHDVAASNEDAEPPTNTENQGHNDVLTVSMSDRCDTPLTGMYMAHTDNVEDAQNLTDGILTLSQTNTDFRVGSFDIHQASTIEDKVTTDLLTSCDHFTIGQYVPYNTTVTQDNTSSANSTQFDHYQDSNVALGNYVSNDTTTYNQQQSIPFDAQNFDQFTLTTGGYMPHTIV